MEIQHIGHAGLLVRIKPPIGNDLVIACDPWFNPAFLNSWFPWPDNREHMTAARNAQIFYISHAHEDHFDRKFLSSIAHKNRVVVVIPDFRSKYLEREVRKLGFTQVVPLKHNQGLLLDKSRGNKSPKVTMLLDRSHKEDSALLIEDGHFRFLNSNDCELAAPDWPQDIDLLAAQFSGAFWYPHCYSWPTTEIEQAKIDVVNQNNLDRLVRRLHATKAKAYLPSAGPPVFLDPGLRKYNFQGIFLEWCDVEEEVLRRVPDLEIHPYEQGDLNTFERYCRQRKDEWASWYQEDDTAATVDEIDAHFWKLQKYNKRFLRDYRGDVRLRSGSGDWQVRIGVVAGELEDSFHPNYHMNVAPRVLRTVLDGRATWETALLSMRVGLQRFPDVYDNALMSLLTYGDRPVQTTAIAAQQASEEVFQRDGYERQRWCPHAGEDMKLCSIREGVVTCARHEWQWDAETGECLTGQGVPLRIRRQS